MIRDDPQSILSSAVTLAPVLLWPDLKNIPGPDKRFLRRLEECLEGIEANRLENRSFHPSYTFTPFPPPHGSHTSSVWGISQEYGSANCSVTCCLVSPGSASSSSMALVNEW